MDPSVAFALEILHLYDIASSNENFSDKSLEASSIVAVSVRIKFYLWKDEKEMRAKK